MLKQSEPGVYKDKTAKILSISNKREIIIRPSILVVPFFTPSGPHPEKRKKENHNAGQGLLRKEFRFPMHIKLPWGFFFREEK